MPLRIVAARSWKTKKLYIRGSHLGVRVDQSCRTDRRPLARSILKRIEKAIERGEYPPRQVSHREPSFLTAAVAYMEAGRSRRYLARLIRHFGETPISEIDQAAIDQAAIALYPNVTPATRNACVYTPVSAVLRHAGTELKLKRPKGAKGRVVTDWLRPADAFGIIAAADSFDRELGALLRFLLYTGVRLGAALELRREDLRLEERRAWVRHQKGQPASDVVLRDDLAEALGELGEEPGRVFRWHQGGHLKYQLVRAKLAHLGVPCPDRRPVGWLAPPHRLTWVNFHSFRHTWATWMRQAGADVQGLVATGNWRDQRSAARYAHAIARDEWSRVDRLPGMVGKSRGGGEV